MKNLYGEECKPNYEVALKTFSSINPNAREDEDYETVEYCIDGSYRECAKAAKELSKSIGQTILCNNTKELAAVAIVCYLIYEECSYDPVWDEYYVNGKKDGRYYY